MLLDDSFLSIFYCESLFSDWSEVIYVSIRYFKLLNVLFQMTQFFPFCSAIRQQLMNTEDIRRMRKKAPCTRPDIWIIEKSVLEDEIFNESIITG